MLMSSLQRVECLGGLFNVVKGRHVCVMTHRQRPENTLVQNNGVNELQDFFVCV